MSEDRKNHRLSPRDYEILKDVVRTYIFTGEPVSSRSLAKRPRHELSAAPDEGLEGSTVPADPYPEALAGQEIRIEYFDFSIPKLYK